MPPARKVERGAGKSGSLEENRGAPVEGKWLQSVHKTIHCCFPPCFLNNRCILPLNNPLQSRADPRRRPPGLLACPQPPLSPPVICWETRPAVGWGVGLKAVGWSQSRVAGPTAAATPGNLLEIHTIGPTPELLIMFSRFFSFSARGSWSRRLEE